MHKYARTTTIVGTRGGGTAHITEGEVWSHHDPIVIDNPDLFADEPTKVRGEKKKADPVEEATAAPGEKRTTKRTTKS